MTHPSINHACVHRGEVGESYVHVSYVIWYEHLGRRIQVQGESHDSVDDARASMELFKLVKGKWEKELDEKKKTKKKKG